MPSSSSHYLEPIIIQSGSSRSSSRNSSATYYTSSSRDSSYPSTMGRDERSIKHRVPDHRDHYVTTIYSEDGRVAVTNHKKTGYDQDEPRSKDARQADKHSSKEHRSSHRTH